MLLLYGCRSAYGGANGPYGKPSLSVEYQSNSFGNIDAVQLVRAIFPAST